MSASNSKEIEIPYDNDEKIINWEEEANGIINDVKSHVAEIEIAKELPCNECKIYLNIRTIEGETYCVQVSGLGFRIVSEKFNTIDDGKQDVDHDAVNEEEEAEEVYETPYALLDKISPSYVKSFGNQLCQQLLNLQQMRTQFNEEEEDELDANNKDT